jgi:hypothetical protein
LVAALGFVDLQWRYKPAAVGALERWLHSWRGVGDILAGMTAQGFNVELREFPAAWRANFYSTGIAHSIVVGSAWEPTPWRAVQRAAWETCTRREQADGDEDHDGSYLRGSQQHVGRSSARQSRPRAQDRG